GSEQCVNGTCSSSSNCSPANCSTCCYGDECVSPATNTQCGAGGAPCVPCPTSYSCELTVGQCVQGNGCATCNTGCCLNNICYPGTSPAACGANGATCDTCDPNEICSGGRCQTSTTECNISTCWGGCCSPTGCVLNGSYNDANCGVAATGCDTCTAFETCQAGSCMNETTLCQQTCDNGCCYGGDCKPFAYQDNSSCGNSGNTCAACYNGTNCDRTSGLCTAPTYCTSCVGADKCCDSSTCRMGNSQGYCGSNGGACERCPTLTTPCRFNNTINRYVCQTSAQTCPNCTGLNQCCANGTCQVGDGSTNYCGSNGLPCGNCTRDQCQLLNGNYQCVQTSERWRVCLERIEVDCARSPDCKTDGNSPAAFQVSIFPGLNPFYAIRSSWLSFVPGQHWTYSFGTALCIDNVATSEITDGLSLLIEEDDFINEEVAGCYNSMPIRSEELATGYATTTCDLYTTSYFRFLPQ
ncbi:MAG: hypothetical protein JRH20_26055, partial [Deltaproteobacteria bacterium]|nr:hypothetical protein [Deltaproteobacteria bacterium]